MKRDELLFVEHPGQHWELYLVAGRRETMLCKGSQSECENRAAERLQRQAACPGSLVWKGAGVRVYSVSAWGEPCEVCGDWREGCNCEA